MTCEVHSRLPSEKPIAFTGAGRLPRIEGAAGLKFASTTAWECSFINCGSVGTFREVRTLFSSYRPCKRVPIPGLDGFWAKLFAILTCCLAVVSVSGCGSAAGSSTTGTTNTGTAGTGAAASAALSALSCSNASMTGAGSDTCTVTLSSAAGSGGVSVGLASSNAAVTVPATVAVAANATSASFAATASSVTAAQSVTLTASAGGVSKTFALQLNVAGTTVPTLTISATSLAFGNVTVNTPSTLPVTLTSAGTAPVTINSATLSGTGFTMSGATFPVTLNPSLAVTLEVQFDPTTAGALTGQLTIQSNSSTNSTAVIGLSGTGASASGSHQVTLNWDAPSNSSDPVVGYDIYRANGGSSTYQLLNSSADVQTTYVDTAVLANATYVYYVTSVDSSGVQSTSSNQVTATIP
jgi:Abnormal spindle-like microcephaly-assoc'd, ASPM-SPD-2-Hydin